MLGQDRKPDNSTAYYDAGVSGTDLPANVGERRMITMQIPKTEQPHITFSTFLFFLQSLSVVLSKNR